MITTEYAPIKNVSVTHDEHDNEPVVILQIDEAEPFTDETRRRVEYTMTLEAAKGMVLKLQAGVEETNPK
ncbi:MAG: hypothetical protein K6L60_07975 [Oceanobacter sp.]